MSERYCLIVCPHRGGNTVHYFNDPYEVKAFLEGVDTVQQFTVENVSEVVRSVDLYRAAWGGDDFRFAEMLRSSCEGEYVRTPVYIETETDRIVTESDLRELWREEASNREQFERFPDYVRACLKERGGTLEVIG